MTIRHDKNFRMRPIVFGLRPLTGNGFLSISFETLPIRRGAIADLVLFDPDTVIDRATPLAPDAISDGITLVWVAGDLVFADDRVTVNRPGRVIRRSME